MQTSGLCAQREPTPHSPGPAPAACRDTGGCEFASRCRYAFELQAATPCYYLLAGAAAPPAAQGLLLAQGGAACVGLSPPLPQVFGRAYVPSAPAAAGPARPESKPTPLPLAFCAPRLRPLAFSPNPALGSGTHNATQLVGWRIGERPQRASALAGRRAQQRTALDASDDCTRSIFALNLGGANVTMELPGEVRTGAVPGCIDRVGGAYRATILFPRSMSDAVHQLLPLAELGRTELSGALPRDLSQRVRVEMPPHSMLSFRVVASLDV